MRLAFIIFDFWVEFITASSSAFFQLWFELVDWLWRSPLL